MLIILCNFGVMLVDCEDAADYVDSQTQTRRLLRHYDESLADKIVNEDDEDRLQHHHLDVSLFPMSCFRDLSSSAYVSSLLLFIAI